METFPEDNKVCDRRINEHTLLFKDCNRKARLLQEA